MSDGYIIGDDKIKVFPQGMALGGAFNSSFILFKNKDKKISFPIWCPDWMGHVSLDEAQKNAHSFELSESVLSKLGFNIVECCFHKVHDDEQKALVYLKRNERIESLELNAIEAVLLCHFTKVTYTASKDFISVAREMEFMEGKTPTELLKKNSFLKSNQKYLM